MGQRTAKRWRQWTEQEARKALTEWEESGMAADTFARRKGVSAHRLRYWRSRLAGTPEVTFVPVALPLSSGARIEVEHAGVVVRIREDLDVEHLARIVAALARTVISC